MGVGGLTGLGPSSDGIIGDAGARLAERVEPEVVLAVGSPCGGVPAVVEDGGSGFAERISGEGVCGHVSGMGSLKGKSHIFNFWTDLISPFVKYLKRDFLFATYPT